MNANLIRVVTEELSIVIDDDHPKRAQCEAFVEKLMNIINPSDVSKILTPAYSLKPELVDNVLYFRSGSIKTKPIGFENEIRMYKVPEVVIEKATNIYLMLDKVIKKQNPRKELFFYCIYNAYRMKRIPCIPELLAAQIFVGLKDSSLKLKIQSSINSISPMIYGVGIPIIIHNPQYYTRVFLQEMSIPIEFEQSVNSLLKEAGEMCNNFDGHKPHYVCYVAITRLIVKLGLINNPDFNFSPSKKPIKIINSIFEAIEQLKEKQV